MPAAPQANRAPLGAALLVAGYGFEPEGTLGAAQVLGRIGEVLLAGAATWKIRRLSAAAGERHAPSRASMKRFVDELTQQPVSVAILAATGVVVSNGGEPALVTGSLHDDYPEDATLPLSWLRERLESMQADRMLLALSVRTRDPSALACLRALGSRRSAHVIAVHASESGCALLDAVLAGLCGEALDARTGLVTMHSISEHLARAVPDAALQPSSALDSLTSIPPLAGPWDMRLSRMAFVTRPTWRDGASPAPDDLAGVVLPGRFRIESELARGSFGTVYRSRQLAIERDVAVKVLHAGVDLASADGRLFVQEIQSVGRIDHPNVVRIFQADVTPDGRLFFAMELLAGADLQRIIDTEGILPPARAVALMQQLLAGLAAVHDAGLIHADIKPANAFVAPGRDGERLVLIDFGLARLKPVGGQADSAGGTPAYMAPEQLHNERVDNRSDLFSAALVLVTLLTGWRRKNGRELVPPFDGIDSERLRHVLARALALDPAERYQTASDFAAALEPGTASQLPPAPDYPPFHHLAPLTERDRGHLYGRDRDLTLLTENVLYRRAVLFTGPSGMGKTSLLGAGLVPRLEALGAHAVLVSCRPALLAQLPSAISAGAATMAEAITTFHRERGGKLVIILDQVEAVLDGRATDDVIAEAVAFEAWPADADVTVVLSVREDYLAPIISRTQRFDEGLAIVRLGPLDDAGTRAAIIGPLTERRLAIAPDLLEALVTDLRTAATSLAAELGWAGGAAAYPPHLQLACSVLYESLGRGEAVITLDHYRRLGGLDAIVGEHLERVLDTELEPSDAAVARDLFLELVTTGQTRAFRSETELLDGVGGRHGVERVRDILEALRTRGLLVRVRATAGEAGWELIHDSLVPRVLAWLDSRDLARRRAIELVRYHLRRSRHEAPSLLGAAELRELRGHEAAIAELDAEWARRPDAAGWTPRRLVDRSKKTRRQGVLSIVGGFVVLLAVAGVAVGRTMVVSAERQREQSLRDRDMGWFALDLRPFDWDPAQRRTIPVAASTLPDLEWHLFEPDEDDLDVPGRPVGDSRLVRSGRTRNADGQGQLEHVETSGGSAFLVVTGRHGAGDASCSPSIIHLVRLPGYARRGQAEPLFTIRVPTCQATRADTVEIPEGYHLNGVLGDPPAAEPNPTAVDGIDPVHLSSFALDRTEVTNAAFAVFAEMGDLTGIQMRIYPNSPQLREADLPDRPVATVTWFEARAYCRFLGKELPTTEQWTKAMRGGLVLPDGQANPRPIRNLPWGAPIKPAPARLADTGIGPAPVGSHPGDVSPYGILDLAGNVQEWTDSPWYDQKTRKLSRSPFRVVRGAGWGNDTASLPDLMALENPRSTGYTNFGVGVRCAVPMPRPAADRTTTAQSRSGP